MAPGEEQLRQENSRLQEQVRRQQEVIEGQSQPIALLSAPVEELQAHLSKDSHHSHLPPSSDRCKRRAKSLRKKSSKKAGGQAGHPGEDLPMAQTPDQVISHAVETCPGCQHDLRDIPAVQVERRQVVELPATRLVVRASSRAQGLSHLPGSDPGPVPRAGQRARARWSDLGRAGAGPGRAAVVTL